MLDTAVRLWDLASGKQVCLFEGHSEPVWALDVSQDGRVVVSASNDGTIRLWKLDSAGHASPRHEGQLVYSFFPQSPRCLALSRDGQRLLVGLEKEYEATPNYDLWLLDVSSTDRLGQVIRRYVGHDEPVSAVALSADKRIALSGALSGVVFLWDIASGQLIHRMKGHTSSVSGVTIDPQGRFAVTSSQDGSLVVWDLETGQAIRRYLGHRGQVIDLCIAPDGRTVFSAGADLTVRQWRIDATQEALIAWIRANRYVPKLTPEQRARYHLDLLRTRPDRASR
jgi:WD40 repeat protein